MTILHKQFIQQQERIQDVIHTLRHMERALDALEREPGTVQEEVRTLLSYLRPEIEVLQEMLQQE